MRSTARPTGPILRRAAAAALAFVLGSTAVVIAAPAPLRPPPQDQGLPYTRSARTAALAKIKDQVAVFAGSRYAFVTGLKVRLDDVAWRDEAVLRDGVVYVPVSFAGLVTGKEVKPDPAPPYLEDRWVHTLPRAATAPGPARTIDVDGRPFVALVDIAASRGLKVYQHARGLVLVGHDQAAFGDGDAALLDSVITLFDTPEKLADPDIATRHIPSLARQGKWTDHVNVTPEQLALLNGAETRWETAPKSSYDFTGFNAALLGSSVPPPGVYPRLLFSDADIPMLAARVRSTNVGRMSLVEMEHLLSKTWWDPGTSDGRVFRQLSSGDLGGLEWDAPRGTPLHRVPHVFKGQKPGIHNSHVAYNPECLTAMALWCLLTNNDARGRQVAAAVANYYRLREPLVDEWLTVSDSEFGTSYTREDGGVAEMNGNGAQTHWRDVHGVVAHMNLGMALDLAGKWMTADEKDSMRRIIAKATYGRRSYGQDGPARFRDVNWMAWDLPHFLAVAAIEGLPGFDPEVYATGLESVRAFCDWGIDSSGVVYESNGKTAGSFQFLTLAMVTLARRGENLFGHPHWRRLLEGQIQMTSPNGRVTVNSGTQYSPYSREALSLMFVTQMKGFFPGSRQPDYLVTKAITRPGAASDEYLRAWPRDGFTQDSHRRAVASLNRLRLPSLTYPGFVHAVLYDADTVPTTRADLNLPLDFTSPDHGVYSAYSDRTPDAVWMNLLVRPDHYLGAGHHHADAGMFHFSALGVDWFAQSPFHQQYDGKYFNLVQVDGESEPTAIPGQILGYNGAADYLGAVAGKGASVGTADLTYAYSWRWLTQPPQVWSDELKALPWEMDPSPRIQQLFAGTARYKMRPWWPTYTYSGYVATSRAPFNPMQYVYRSAGIVRGGHPYGFVIDDLKKDDGSHLYQWVAMLSGGVWQARFPGLAENQIVLGYEEADPSPWAANVRPTLEPKQGDPLLLVCVPSLIGSDDPRQPLFKIERTAGPADRNGRPQYFDRIVISRRSDSVAFRVLLVPFRAGEPLPSVTYDRATETARVSWPDQADEFTFTAGEDHRTRVVVSRAGETLVESK